MEPDSTGIDGEDTAPHPRRQQSNHDKGNGQPGVRPDVWESHRLYIEHHLFHYVLGGNYIATLQNPRFILDVGCGPGHWGFDMARQHPMSQVVGVDIDIPLLPKNAPPNYRAVAVSALDQLPFDDATFDYAHMRLQAMKIRVHQWPLVLREMLRVTRPGGWVELLELGMPDIGQPFIWKCLAALGRRDGLDIFPGMQPAYWLQQAGAEDVQTREVMLSRELSDGRTGRLLMHDMLQIAERVRDDILALNITTAGSYDMALASMQRHLLRATRTETLPVYVMVGRRPTVYPPETPSPPAEQPTSD